MNTPFQIVQDEWMQIAPLGDHAHAQGIQRVDAVCVAQMANRFNSFRARIGRMFAGVPVFEGHHDSDPTKYPNGRSFGWVMELQDRASDGLWARVKWSDEGRQLVKSGQYKFVSPLWTGREIARENGKIIYRPEDLLSLALTNLPNLPLPPLANQRSPLPPGQPCLATLLPPNCVAPPSQIASDMLSRPALSDDKIAKQPQPPSCDQASQRFYMKTLTEILELNEDAAAEQICAKAEILANERATVTRRAEALANELALEKKKVEEERAARIELILANAIMAGRMILAEKERWRGELQ